MQNIPYKFEMSSSLVKYLLQAVDRLQISGEDQAMNMLQAKAVLRRPLNMVEIQAQAAKETKPATEQEVKPVAEDDKSK